jgi:phospholipase/carboxylesterase
MFVPSTYSPPTPAPLLILLHGAGQEAKEWTSARMQALLDTKGIVGIMPDSRLPTWDMIYDDYGIDVKFIDRAMEHVFTRCLIDPARIALAGFSDGATYALSLGITNANLTRTVLAFSPGFVKPAAKTGKPRIFISHGTNDPILPIDATSREIVAALREKNYPLRYEEFEGGHQVTPEIAMHAIDYFLN